jgi:formylglycine-generating enzyme required for sulfatase activity
MVNVAARIGTHPNISQFKGARNPVERVSWDDAQAFCKQMSQKTGRPVRLPSEAEWEYACRAGSTTPHHPPRERGKATTLTNEQRRHAADLIPKLSSEEHEESLKATRDLIALGSGVLPLLDEAKVADPEGRIRMTLVKEILQSEADLISVAWFIENSEKPHPAGEKEPNAFNLYDMHGNVWEWVEDDWHDNYTGAPKDGSAWIETPRDVGRVLRGGYWDVDPGSCRSAYRFRLDPEVLGSGFGELSSSVAIVGSGFRVVLSSPPRAP